MIISLSFLEFEWKILYHWKANILNFFMVQKFFCILKIFWVTNFSTKIVYFFYYIKKYHFSSLYKKNFLLWKLLVELIILQKKFWKKCVHWWPYDGLNMIVIFRQVNFLYFVKILKEKWSIFSGWNSVCNSKCQHVINEDNFSQSFFAK